MFGWEWIGHHRLLRMVVLEGKVVNEEPLRVGASRVYDLSSITELAVVKVWDPLLSRQVPVIPGSSWKGLFRSEAVAILRNLGLRVCDGAPGHTCLRGEEFKMYRGAGVQEKLGAVLRGDVRLCIACLLFGSPSFAAHLQFEDSVPEDGWALGYRTMATISRRTGAALPGRLFTPEYVEPGTRFSFRVYAKNVPNYALGLLYRVVENINAGIAKVGGFKSRGFGKVRFERLGLRFYEPAGGWRDRGLLKALDPLDSDVDTTGDLIADGSTFVSALERALGGLARVSERGWRWVE